ncbi:uncharacterized protein K460DRAFT_434671 [Cucurbitaria berberidis CBS 394.84]|uniref:Uncharacterized protein n=1 Tax=Cucurbitaria berberidis CBS 394.84 TaxID=1168544 RepID=A0A9P4G9Y5_9PLEO|nr:uncharacterized protein K460DRAFT_434671 [Cucurbitaria berberidis CBS 394.84]KAF1841571.1 hypothetical protein K460DRAFT_434671 [Cucurbitaria berberidis CBS 394.84]
MSNPGTAKPIGIKKVKVANKGSQIKKWAGIIDTATKTDTPTTPTPFSQAEDDLSTQQASVKKAKAEGVLKSSVKERIEEEATDHTVASSTSPPRALKTKPTTKQDDFDLFPTERDTLEPKMKKRDEDSERRDQAISRAPRVPNIPNKFPKAKLGALPPDTPVKKAPEVEKVAPNLAQSISLQRMKDDAMATLEQRRKSLVAACAAIEPLKAGSKATFVALASWGLSVERHFAPKDDDEPVAAVEKSSVVHEASLDEVVIAELFGNNEVEKKPLPLTSNDKAQDTEVTDTTPKAPKAQVKPATPRPRAQASFMFNSKRKDPNASISRPLQSMPAVDRAKATTTSMIDSIAARHAEMKSEKAEKKQTGTKKEATKTEVTKKAAGGTKTTRRVYKDSNGNLNIRKGKALSCAAGEKRKRGDVLKLPNKRAAIEGRDFASLRARRAMSTADPMEMDVAPALPLSTFSYTL